MRRYTLFISITSLVVFGIVFYSLFSATNTSLLTVTPAAQFAATTSVSVAASSTVSKAPSYQRPSPAKTALVSSSTPASISAAPAPDVTIVINGTSYPVYVPAGATVIDAMNTLASTTDTFTFTGRDYSGLGFFVEAIDGKQGADGSGWFLYVNGKSSDTGASQTALKAGDTVEWRYEKNH